MARGLADFDPSALYRYRSSYPGPDGARAPLTAEALGKLVGASKAQILAYENGHRTPDPARIRELAKHLGIRPVDLMRREGRRRWDLADRRRASGLTAKELSEKLCISPKSYRRFEQQGIVPARRPKFLDDLAKALDIQPRVLQLAIDNTPAVMDRRTQTTDIIQELADSYVLRPGVWKGPDLEDPGVTRLAEMYGRPPQRIRRILTRVLGELRQMSVRMQRERIIADFDPEISHQQQALSAIERWEEVYDAELLRIPARLEGFHRSAQPSDAWQVLVDLHDAETTPDGTWVPSVLLGRPETMQQLPPSLVTQREFDGMPAAQLRNAGVRHVRNFQEFYAALYPGLRRPRPRSSTTRRGGTSAGRASVGFALPGRSERFVVPPHLIDRTMLSTNAGPSDLWLSPTLRLSISPVAGRPTAVAHDDDSSPS